MSDFADKGFLWPQKERRSEKSPNLTGKVELSKATLMSLIDTFKQTGKAEIRLAAWRSDRDPQKLSLKASVDDGERQQSTRGGGGGYRQREEAPRREAPARRPPPREYNAEEYEETSAGFGGRRREEPKRSNTEDFNDDIPWD